MRRMFRVTFRNADNDRNLTGQLVLPVVPDKGEKVRIRQKPDSWKALEGVVLDRIWFICDEDATQSDVVVMVGLDQKKR